MVLAKTSFNLADCVEDVSATGGKLFQRRVIQVRLVHIIFNDCGPWLAATAVLQLVIHLWDLLVAVVLVHSDTLVGE